MLIEVLKKIPDHRDLHARQYQLWEVLFLTVCAILSNAKTYEDIWRFAEVHLENFKEHFGFKWKGVPHVTQIRNILIGIDVKLMEKTFQEHANFLLAQENRKHICFDGKALRGSLGRGLGQLHLFTAFEAFEQIVLAHMPLSDKESEIPAFEAFLKTMDLNNIIVTADAMHCQKKTSH